MRRPHAGRGGPAPSWLSVAPNIQQTLYTLVQSLHQIFTMSARPLTCPLPVGSLDRRAGAANSPAGARAPRRRAKRPGRLHRDFNPAQVGALECVAWTAYYRRDWPRFLIAGLIAARRCFALPWPATLACAWYVMRANQRWAPYPDNDPDGARRDMERFYEIARRHTQERFAPSTAAALEVEWWRLHRANQHGQLSGGEAVVVDAVTRLYAYTYHAEADLVRPAAAARVRAMGCTDRWVADGCPSDSPLVEQARGALIESYAALRRAVR